MPLFFTVYWIHDANDHLEGMKAVNAFSNLFTKRGVRRGDVCYLVSNRNGRPFLVARMTVNSILKGQKTILHLTGRRPQKVSEMIKSEDGTNITFKRMIPTRVARSIQFQSADRLKGLLWDDHGLLNEQTLRGVRRITEKTAKLFDNLIEPPVPIPTRDVKSAPYPFERSKRAAANGVAEPKRGREMPRGAIGAPPNRDRNNDRNGSGRRASQIPVGNESRKTNFTAYWNRDKDSRLLGERLTHIFGERLVERDIRVGDRIYVVTKYGGTLRLTGRLTVAEVAANPLALHAKGIPLDGYNEALVGMDGSLISFLRIIPNAISRQLKKNGIHPITNNIADRLDELIDTPLIPEEVTGKRFTEGAVERIMVNRYERDDEARLACLEHYGRTCQICFVGFTEVYGERAKDIIHVHHLKPIHEIGTKYEVDPIKDLLPVCPNCHAVLHLNAGLLEPGVVRGMIKQASSSRAMNSANVSDLSS